MNENLLYEKWLKSATEDSDIYSELKEIEDNTEEIYDRFYRELEFGTGGIRGVIGAGTNRMNIYTIRKTTAGLAVTLKEDSQEPSVAISYDSRRKSLDFAREAARVLAAAGVKSYIYSELMPTPCLSFAVRALRCSAGIMITASHNPAKYNGFKCYGPDGCQMTDDSANRVLANVNKQEIFDIDVLDFKQGIRSGMISYIKNDIIEDFYAHIRAQTIRPDAIADTDLSVVYTPLNGTGNKPVCAVLKRMGLKNFRVVAEQEKPDPDFTTCPFPNPEIPEALALGLRDSKEVGADLLLATDPDCDRVGIAVKDGEEYKLLSGNEVGALLLEYICARRLEYGNMPIHPMAVKTIVSTELAAEIAKSYGVRMPNVLTGFKYIGEQIGYLEKIGAEDQFIFGFEESYGYLIGTHARDKDAVVASMLIVEMAAFYHQKKSSLIEELEKLYVKYGYYLHTQSNFVCEGASGMRKMEELMSGLRQNPPESVGGLKVVRREDYQTRIWQELSSGESGELTLPKSNVLVYKLENKCGVVLRPSGTEPKIKAYYTAWAEKETEARKIEERLREDFTHILGF